MTRLPMCLPTIYFRDGQFRRHMAGHKSTAEGHVRSDLSFPHVGDGCFYRELSSRAAMNANEQGCRLCAVKTFGVGW